MRAKMFRSWLLYGICLGLLAALMAWVKYRFTIIDYALEIYGLITAVVFIITGIWLGLKLSKPKTIVQTETVVREVPVMITADREKIAPQLPQQLGISQREVEVLQFLSRGMSNQEIADQLFVSQNTVKTHLSNLYFKLDVKRRTQAVEKARTIGILP